MKIRVNLIDGNTIDLDAPDGFSFENFCLAIKAYGELFNSTIYVPHHAIVSIFPVGTSPTVTGMTKQ